MRELIDLSRDLVSLDQTVGTDDDASLGDFIADERATRPAEASVEAGLMRAQLRRGPGHAGARGRPPWCGCATGSTAAARRRWTRSARAFKLSRERIRQIERETMAKLRHPSRAQVAARLPGAVTISARADARV